MKPSKKLLAIILFLAGCGGSGGGSTGNTAPPAGAPPPSYPAVEGKWTVDATSSNGNRNSFVLVDLVNQGSGAFYGSQTVICNYVTTIQCAGNLIGGTTQTITTKGTVTPAGVLSISVTITGATGITGQNSCTLSINGTLNGATAMSGEYTGCNDDGTWTGASNGPSTGTYTGTLVSSDNGMTFEISASITETNTFMITGSASITGSPCFTSLTFGPPSQAVGEGMLLEDTQHGVTALAIPGEQGPNVVYVVTPTQYCQADNGYGAIFTTQPLSSTAAAKESKGREQ